MAGLRTDEISLYRKDMYKAEREGAKLKPAMRDKIFNIVSGKEVNGAGNKATQLLGAPALTRHLSEGQNIAFTSPKEGWTTYVKYYTYSAGMTFSFEAIQDTVKLGNKIKDLSKTWGRELEVAKESLAVRGFNEGGNLLGDTLAFDGSYIGEADPSGALLYDSKPLFNLTGNTRTTKGGGTYYNSVASLSVNAANFETVYNLMTDTNAHDEEDRNVDNEVDSVLSRPGANHFAFQRILNSDNLAGGQLNDKNPYVGLIKNIFKWSYLESAEAAWFVGKAKHEAWEFHERMAPLMKFFENNDNNGYKASTMSRFGVWFKAGAWRAWGRGGGTSA